MLISARKDSKILRNVFDFPGFPCQTLSSMTNLRQSCATTSIGITESWFRAEFSSLRDNPNFMINQKHECIERLELVSKFSENLIDFPGFRVNQTSKMKATTLQIGLLPNEKVV
jgi:hypothetical protein